MVEGSGCSRFWVVVLGFRIRDLGFWAQARTRIADSAYVGVLGLCFGPDSKAMLRTPSNRKRTL